MSPTAMIGWAMLNGTAFVGVVILGRVLIYKRNSQRKSKNHAQMRRVRACGQPDMVAIEARSLMIRVHDLFPELDLYKTRQLVRK